MQNGIKNGGDLLFPADPTPLRDALWIAAIALCYFAAARLGLMLVLQPEGIAPIWLPGGIFLSAILLTRRERRPFLVAILCVTDFISEMLAGTPVMVSAIYALVLAAEAVLSAWLLGRFAGEPVLFRKLRQLVGFLVMACFLSNFALGFAAAAASRLIPGTTFWGSWVGWVSTDGIGNLLVTPFLLSWASAARAGLGHWKAKRVLEAAGLLIPLVFLNLLAFGTLSNTGLFSMLLPFSTFPLLIWAALRFGMRGVTAALALLTAIVIGFAASGRLSGFSVYGLALNEAIIVQFYLAIMAIPALFLAVVVTERAQGAETLREREARLNKAEEIAQVGSWVLDFTSGRLEWSDEVYRIFGLAPQEFGATYRAFLEAVHPEDRTAVDEAYTRSLREGKDFYEIEHRVVWKSTGEVRYVHEKCEHLRDASRRIVRSVGMVHDITERKQAEEAFRELSRKNEEALRVARMGHWEFDVPTGLFTFNDQYYALHGITAREAGGYQMSAEDFARQYVHPDYIQLVREVIQQAIASEDPGFQLQFEGWILRGDGEARMVTVWFRVEKDERNATVKLYGVNQDITERRRAEQALQESEWRFRSLLEQAADGFELADAEGRFIDVNGATCRQLGYSKEELLQLSVLDIDPAVDRETYAARFQQLAGGSSLIFETLHRRKDGTTFPVEINTSGIRLGEEFSTLTLVRDISERKREEREREKLRAQLVQAKKMESVGRLAGGVAHDFNNMLEVILGNTELALSDLPPSSSLREGLQEIAAAAQRSADLTRQLLAFARKQTITPRVLDLNDAVAGVLKMLRRLIGEDIDLAWIPEAELWPVKMDGAQIDQILANLCINARDAISGAGKVTIETAKVSFDEAYCADHPGSTPGQYVLLAVSDDGSGMSKEVLDNLFEPFFTTKDLPQSAGLGLATVYGIVKQNEGFINVYSELGKGTSFKIYLPRFAGETVAEAEGGKKAPRPRGTETVLLVEDEEMILRLGAKLLGFLGYTVLAAQTPSAALAIAAGHRGPIHLLITDVVMPEMSGKELSEKLVALRPETRVLFTSGYTANTIAHHGVLEEGVEFLPKPFSISVLAAKVREILDRR